MVDIRLDEDWRLTQAATGDAPVVTDRDSVSYTHLQGIPLYEIEFPKVIVSYASAGERTRQDVLNRVSFSKFSHKNAQGDNCLLYTSRCV